MPIQIFIAIVAFTTLATIVSRNIDGMRGVWAFVGTMYLGLLYCAAVGVWLGDIGHVLK